MAKNTGTKRRTTHYEDEVVEDLDVKMMLEALLRKKGTLELMEAYARLKTKKDWREARKKLVPLADVILAHKALYARSDQAQIRAAELLLLYAGEKPAERLQHAGDGGGPIRFESEYDMSQLSTAELRQLRGLIAKAKPAAEAKGA